MNRQFVPFLVLIFLLCIGVCEYAVSQSPIQSSSGFRQPDASTYPDLYYWTDTCNTFVIRDGTSALLIDLGDGSVLDHLDEIGVQQVEWVLFTHHHREQCQGAPRLKGSGTKVAAPEAEAALFRSPPDFRKMQVRLEDVYTIHGSSYVRPPIRPIALDKTFNTMDVFTWHNHEIWCVDTRGNSPGGMSYLLKQNERWLAFSGDVMLDGARMHTWFDTEWDYGFAKGIYALHNSAALLADFDPLWLLPSHGVPIREPQSQLVDYQAKLRHLEKHYVRGYDIFNFGAASQDPVSQPTSVPHVWQVSPHLFKFKGPNYSPNFNLILSESGHALMVDCGLMGEDELDMRLEQMKQRLGLKQIDAMIVTHMHGDHFLQAPYLKEKWGAQIWALDRMGPVCEHPEWFDYAAPIQAYGDGFEGLRFDRLFRSGETFQWEEFTFTVDWMPGQTEFALCLQGEIDGRLVAFTGDNIFGNPRDPSQTGHEAMVAHNSAILEEGYIYAGEYLSRLKPDILVGGHSYVMDNPAAFIERYRQWAYDMRDAFQSLSPDPDYRLFFDPFWVRAKPYRLHLKTGESGELVLHVRNFRPNTQTHRIEIHTPPGLVAEPSVLEASLPAEAREAFSIRLHTAGDATKGVNIIAFDVTLDGERYGERFDAIINME